MNDESKRKHAKTKKALKIVGPCIAVIGLIFAIIGMVDFFSSMKDIESMPDKFWCFFVGFPLIAIGLAMTAFGFKREIVSYIKNEATPVLNEFGKEIKPAVSAIADAVKHSSDEPVLCPKCGIMNRSSAQFCKSCGAPLGKVCPHCGEKVEGGEFCDKCGGKLN